MGKDRAMESKRWKMDFCQNAKTVCDRNTAADIEEAAADGGDDDG